MYILEELREFIRHILHEIYLLLALALFLLIFGLQKTAIWGKTYLIPRPTDNSFAVQVFKMIQQALLPPGVHLIVTNPLSAFVSQILLSILLAFGITLPFLVYKIFQYLSPALFEHEKKAVLKSLLPSLGLFFGGCVFAFYFLIPVTFKILYPYASVIGATPFFSVDEFVASVLGFMVATGVLFLLPLFMVLLSFVGVIRPAFWLSKWRSALLFFLILSAIITPDGTGVTMLLLFGPLAGLYFAGYFFAKRLGGGSIKRINQLTI